MKKILSVIMAIALLVTFIPMAPQKAEAASDYFLITSFSTDVNNPTDVNTEAVDLVGTYNGVSPSSISYEQVSIVVNGDKIDEISTPRGSDVKPVIADTTFRFNAVKLNPGLNKLTVRGTNSVGNVVNEQVFVRYSNAPMIYDIKAADGRVLRDSTDPTVIDTKSITLRATNATDVYVGSKKMYSGDGKNFVASDLPLEFGKNTLVITATNGSKSITDTRDVIYYAGAPTAFGTKIGSTEVNRGSIVNNPSGIITGAVSFLLENSAAETITNFSLSLTDPSSNVVPYTGKVLKVTKDNRFITFYFDSNAATANVTADGTYKLLVKGEYGDQTANYAIDFTNRKNSTPYITDVKQVFNVVDNGSMFTYDRSAPLANNAMFLDMPVYISVKTSDPIDVTLASLINGSNSTALVTSKKVNGNETVFKIENMAPGQQKLVFTPGGVTTDEKVFAVSYVSAPFLEIVNIPDGKVFNKSSDLSQVVVKYTNFSASDLDKLSISINGKKKPLTGTHVAGARTITYDASGDTSLFVPGPNKIIVSGTTNGTPVSTTITVYIFPKNSPEITGVIPVPFVLDPSGSSIPQTGDPNGLFVQGADGKYVTSEKALEVLFTVSSADKLDVKIDGKTFTSAEMLTSGSWDLKNNKIILESTTEKTDENGNPITDEESKPLKFYTFRLLKDPTNATDALSFPKSGEKSIMITVRKGSANVSHTITIVRENASFKILSPKLPDESVINQNFLKVSIESEGAEKILIGKQELVKDAVNDIFRGEVDNLKVGKNTIKFTVVQGKQKTNGQFIVNYAGEKLAGALYKTSIPSSGKTSLFKGDLTIALPKGTLLRESNTTPGQAPAEINMFDNQQILFGIADRKDGRILKRYNAVGEVESNRPQDGIIKEIPADFSATQYLTLPGRFGYASELFWMDAGYIKKDSAGNVIEVIEGALPYKAQTNSVKQPNFYERLNSQWMEPTQRGTITLKYDANIVNAISSNLAVWRWVDRDQKWVNLGGTINATSKTITAPFDGFGYYAVLGVRYTFDDIIGHPYARNSLELMLASDIMKPVDNYEFGVYDNVSRGEFATMLVKILDIPLDYDVNNPTFDDVGQYGTMNSLWDFKYVETAVRKGIIRGVAPRIFDPNGDLTREAAATMISRALNLKLGTLDKDLPALQKQFTDANTVDPYMVSSVLAITKAGYILGLPNSTTAGQKKVTYRFDPKSNMKRADAAVIAERIMKKLKKIK
ncbi:hypothetical protein BVG16_20330 [Paenibacillus selenitireducens]|uniref:SLH domain-containing protein n=1 Tax=Paenibacillus selenitireducens TaxID=1324314 RepID=A0A1T2X767_9BACL|nr:S-layer homology domain-containing protein [Paenibacillus selenitireducens]OPA75682.1 hypothetical protein BVG16_20330 [Paenibacillus selenitireducens]